MQLNMQIGRIVWHDIVFHRSTGIFARLLSRFQTFEKVSCSIKYGNKRYDIVHSITIVKTGDNDCYDFWFTLRSNHPVNWIFNKWKQNRVYGKKQARGDWLEEDFSNFRSESCVRVLLDWHSSKDHDRPLGLLALRNPTWKAFTSLLIRRISSTGALSSQIR